ncbi:glycosyltransferase [Methanobrevibacter millerae]|uniref:Glycosyltransferase involved in cell wall bisynthesis n=1 Tax=Methanobrevibacter millerae TaxID=230361 RepID=A0A1G5V8Y9_9EURY|nr:glycosyltransferase [Methanobrevibacter millerae]SDA42322.1 Glycosyltransferase involved in cell wall bisynthesis [Methanobrevibacter millerae]
MFKITIIIPLSIHHELNDETFESILNQSIGFENLQIIFVYQKLDEYLIDLSENYENIISIKIKDYDIFNGHLYNIGMKHASSNFLMFLKPEEILMDDACELLYNGIINKDIDFISGISKIDENKSLDNELSLFKNFNMGDKLFKKSFITNNNIMFSNDSFDSELSFFINVYSSSKNFKILNKILVKSNSKNPVFSKKMIKGLLDTYYEMFYITQNRDNSHIFNNILLFDNLNYFLTLCSTNKLSADDLLELFIYSKPLFDLYYQNNDFESNNKSPLFDFIFQGKYEDAIYHIFGENTPMQKDILVATLCDQYTYNSFKFECHLFKLNPNNWLNQLKIKKPDLFLFTTSNNENADLYEIIKYCNDFNIPTIVWENKKTDLSKEIFLSFDYIFSCYKESVQYYQNKNHENVNYLMFATQPMLFNPLNKNHKLINKNSKDEKISRTIKTIKREFDVYRTNSLKTNRTTIHYNQKSNLEKKEDIIGELEDCPLLTNENLCNHEIFELMSLNKLIFADYSDLLEDLFGNNIYYFNKDNIDFTKIEMDEIKNKNLHNVLKNHTYTNRFRQILDTINFKYIPYIKHVTLFYNLNNLIELESIYNHFHSIEYPFKQMIIITTEDKLYLPNTILKSQLNDLELFENDYFVFADVNLDSDFVWEAILHSSYISHDVGFKEDIEKKFIFDKTEDKSNIIFNGTQYNHIISENINDYDIYCFNNFQVKVSVIIPVYNVENYLEECLESVINQTLKDIEIICVNDGSTDSSLDILKRYMEIDSRIKIITQLNKGLGDARNTGLAIAKGKYIYFIDSDDVVEIIGLKEMYQQCEFKELDMLKFNLMTFDDETGEKKALYQRVKPAFLQELGDVVFDYKTIGSDVYTLSPNMQSSFFNREAVKNIRFPEKLIFEDNLYLIEALFNSKRVYYYDKFLANKRERFNSITTSTGKNFPDVIEIRNLIVDLAKKYDFYEEYKFTIYSRKYMFIKLLFLQTSDYYKKNFFEKIKEDCINKKEEYENEGIFDILDEKSIKIFNAGLNSKNYEEFEELIRNAR